MSSRHLGQYKGNLYTVQAIRNITNFSCKKFIRIRTNMARIRTNFVLKFVHEIREKFVHEFMPEDYVFKEKNGGKYQFH